MSDRKLLFEKKFEYYSTSWTINRDGTHLAASLRSPEKSYLSIMELESSGRELFKKEIPYKHLIALTF
ncbi:MAG TPA: hypothetical protein PKA06_01795, partial [Gemmatales bacterium]|nr:hypothetical protein [Gemmatales bacterium]